MQQYPDIYIPQELAQIPNSYPLPPFFPAKPIRPTAPRLVLPIVVALVVAMCIILTPVANLFFRGILGLVTGGVIGIVIYAIQRSKYINNISKFRDESEIYPILLDKYEKDQADYIKEIEMLKQPNYMEKYRNQLFRKFLERIYKPDGENSTAPTGKSEFILVNAMRKHLEGNILLKTYLIIPNYEYPYSPDICYIYKGIYIDVEVDEPYYFKNAQYYPSHGYDQWKDSKRNSFFTDRGWIVIRFAEEQVVKHPDQCVKEICNLVKDFTNDSIPHSLKNVGELRAIPRWTTEEAWTMIDNSYRDFY